MCRCRSIYDTKNSEFLRYSTQLTIKVCCHSHLRCGRLWTPHTEQTTTPCTASTQSVSVSTIWRRGFCAVTTRSVMHFWQARDRTAAFTKTYVTLSKMAPRYKIQRQFWTSFNWNSDTFKICCKCSMYPLDIRCEVLMFLNLNKIYRQEFEDFYHFELVLQFELRLLGIHCYQTLKRLFLFLLRLLAN